MDDLAVELLSAKTPLLEESSVAATATGNFTSQDVSHAVITAAMKVHSVLGPGLLESTYVACLQYELLDAGFRSSAQVGLPVVYRGVKLDLGYRMDLVVENSVVVEVKSIDAIAPVHQAQIFVP
jgi:GxxExxY protein